MRDGDRQTRTRLMQLFEQQGLQPRHDLGQNFLVDLNLHDLIVKHAGLTTADVVLEIGTGTGGLTDHLAAAAGYVVSVEFDEHVLGHARALLSERKNVRLLHGDALANKHTFTPAVLNAVNTALGRVQQAERDQFGAAEAHGVHPVGVDDDDANNPWRLNSLETTLKLVANLPYNIATPVISNLMASKLPWSRMVVTIQWELAERMQAKPGTGEYSALTVWLQSQAKLKLIRKLPPSVFWPPPKVDSAVLLIDRWDEGQSRIIDRPWFHDFLRDVFTQRRKRLLGVLATMFSDKKPRDSNPWANAALSRDRLEQLFVELKIPADARAEQLPVDKLVELSNRLHAVSVPLTPDAASLTPNP
ncbi:MAG TPA: rRNA adenine dimethyltransferase family protein [Planctomycetaceae bacterium]|nr:rRNA adenine dimethyltransferase family protein [Planctomycetaceae bacterium]